MILETWDDQKQNPQVKIATWFGFDLKPDMRGSKIKKKVKTFLSSLEQNRADEEEKRRKSSKPIAQIHKQRRTKKEASEENPKMLFWLFNINQMLNLCCYLLFPIPFFFLFFNQSIDAAYCIWFYLNFFIYSILMSFSYSGTHETFLLSLFCLTVFFFLNSFWSSQVFFFTTISKRSSHFLFLMMWSLFISLLLHHDRRKFSKIVFDNFWW